MIIVETGQLIEETGQMSGDSNSWVTETEFADWLTANEYSVSKPAELILSQSFIYLSTLNWRKPHSVEYVVLPCFKYAQMQLARLIDSGEFNPDAQLDDKVLTGSGLGRNAIVKKWEVKSELSGVGLIDLLKRFPAVYMFLQGHVVDGAVGSFELVR